MKHRKQEVPMSDDTRVALLENNIGQIKDTLNQINKRLDSMDSKIDKINDRIWSNFLWLLSMIIGTAVGLAYLMAHGFHWF